MKTIIQLLFILSYTVGISQIDTLNQEMVAMKDTYQKPYDVGTVYYKKGSMTPYTGVLYGTYENGKYLSIQEYREGVGNGTWINYYENGNVKEVGTYVNNLVEGPVKQYREDGSLKAAGQYEHWRKKVGTWKYYNDQGTLEKTVSYK